MTRLYRIAVERVTAERLEIITRARDQSEAERLAWYQAIRPGATVAITASDAPQATLKAALAAATERMGWSEVAAIVNASAQRFAGQRGDQEAAE